jgi:hypothetical protein
LQKYLSLPQGGKIIAEYVWIDGSNGIRSKSRVSTIQFQSLVPPYYYIVRHFATQVHDNWRLQWSFQLSLEDSQGNNVACDTCKAERKLAIGCGWGSHLPCVTSFCSQCRLLLLSGLRPYLPRDKLC